MLTDIILNSILITGLVVIMMMMIESLNIESKGLIFSGLKRTKVGQVVFSALLGLIPGCIGGFASVSLYTHRIISFGALVAMMIVSSGDEAFVMLAMIPEEAMTIFAVLFAVAVITGLTVDFVQEKIIRRGHEKVPATDRRLSDDSFEIHDHEGPHSSENGSHAKRHIGWKRALMFTGVLLFIAALATGALGHDHGEQAHGHGNMTFDLMSEGWMYVLFAGLSVIVLGVLSFASDHFVDGHLWDHVVRKHLPAIFCWTFGVLALIGLGMKYIDIEGWISDNTALMILLAVAIGIIPESGPHLIFVTLYAGGMIPLPVLIASCISQDGHSSLPLIAESKVSFFWAKAINCAVALVCGFSAMLLM